VALDSLKGCDCVAMGNAHRMNRVSLGSLKGCDKEWWDRFANPTRACWKAGVPAPPRREALPTLPDGYGKPLP